MPESGSSPPSPREGSSLYYTLRLAGGAAAARTQARLWLQQAITDTLDDVSDIGVAQHKLHWWHEEIEHIYRGCARHPASLAVANTGPGSARLVRAWLTLLSAVSDRRLSPANSQSERDAALQREWRARLLLIADALHPVDATMAVDAAAALRIDEPSCNALALGMGLSMQLRALPLLLDRGDPVFGEDTYHRYDASRDALAPPSALIQEQVSRAAALLDGVITLWQQTGGHIALREHRPLRVYTRLRHTQLVLWQRDLPDLTREMRVLTPIRKLLIAWRTG